MADVAADADADADAAQVVVVAGDASVVVEHVVGEASADWNMVLSLHIAGQSARNQCERDIAGLMVDEDYVNDRACCCYKMVGGKRGDTVDHTCAGRRTIRGEMSLGS